MNTIDIRQKLHHYIETAEDKKIKAIYTIVEDEISDKYDYWNDESFISEMQKREKSYLEGTSKTLSIKQAAAKARKAIKNKCSNSVYPKNS